MNIKQPTSWRDLIKVHPAADLFPMMTRDELKVLGEDIKKNGLGVPVILWEAEKGAPLLLLDGRNRLDASEAVGLPVLNQDGTWLDCGMRCDRVRGGDPYKFVLSFNEHRRHLTPEQRREIIAKVLKAQPSKSNRTIAKQTKADHKTVGAVRDKLEARGEIPHVSTVEDTKGRKQPTRKPEKRRDVDDYLAEKKMRLAAKDADAPGLAPHRTDPDHLISQFSAQVRSTGLDIARQIEAGYRSTLIERLHEVADEIALEAERWAKEVHRPEEMPGIPEFLRRS